MAWRQGEWRLAEQKKSKRKKQKSKKAKKKTKMKKEKTFSLVRLAAMAWALVRAVALALDHCDCGAATARVPHRARRVQRQKKKMKKKSFFLFFFLIFFFLSAVSRPLATWSRLWTCRCTAAAGPAGGLSCSAPRVYTCLARRTFLWAAVHQSGRARQQQCPQQRPQGHWQICAAAARPTATFRLLLLLSSPPLVLLRTFTPDRRR